MRGECVKIGVVSDGGEWAFGKRAFDYFSNAPKGWTVKMVNSNGVIDDVFDAVFLLDCRASSTHYGWAKIGRLIASHAWLYRFGDTDWRARGVNRTRCWEALESLVNNSDVIAVYNKAQHRVVSGMKPNKLVLAPYAVNRAVFPNYGKRENQKLTVGWCYQAGGGLNSFKGLADILVPVIAKIGDAVDWKVITPEASSCLNTPQLVEYYNSLDVMLCTSSGEGGPQIPFEAASCGCAVVSTDVGQVSDWDALRQLDLIVPTYRNAAEAKETVNLMCERIMRLAKDREQLKFCAESLEFDISENWNASKLCPQQLVEMFGSTEKESVL